MDRQAFGQCIGNAMRGKKFTKEERKKEFCITAKVCSGKAKDRSTAIQQCKQVHPDWKFQVINMTTEETAEASEQRGEIRGLCPKFEIEAPSITCDFFAEFSRRQGWTPDKNMFELDKWGRRFKKGNRDSGCYFLS